MTKEPKLKAAMRIVPEWKDYDYEIKVFWDTIYSTNTRSQIEYEPPELNKEKKGKSAQRERRGEREKDRERSVNFYPVFGLISLK